MATQKSKTMTDKILELTEKIYNEGVVKAKVQAEQIISEAKKEASKIIELAKKKELEILKQAEIHASELRKNTNSELQLASRQFISNLKQQITNLVTTLQIEKPVKEAFQDVKFIQQILFTLIQNWNPQNPEELELNILLPESAKKEFLDFTESKTLESLNRGVHVQFESKISNGFKIGPKNGGYMISFSDMDFENYFKKYLKERTNKLLFAHD